MDKVGVKAEWEKAREVIVYTPRYEQLFYGVIHPSAGSFESAFNPVVAIEEHIRFRTLLSQNGVKVINLEDTIRSDYEALRNLATLSLSHTKIDRNGIEKEDRKRYKEEVLSLHSEDILFQIIVTMPEVVRGRSHSNRSANQGYRVNPLMNLYFQRDPYITTDKGIVIGRMRKSVRKDETRVIETLLGILGINPVYQVNGRGVLEGGDFIPAGRFALIGCGLRTNQEAISQLLKNNAFGYDEVAVVFDPYKKEHEMHLDTYFEIVGEDKALIVQDRIDTKRQKADPAKTSMVQVYERDTSGSYRIKNSLEEGIRFEEYMGSKGFELIPIPKEMQMNYGVNVLTIESGKIIAVKDVHPQYRGLLSKHGIEAVEVDLANLTKGYGGPHCMTQVIKRG